MKTDHAKNGASVAVILAAGLVLLTAAACQFIKKSDDNGSTSVTFGDQVKMKASDAADGDCLGESTAVDGDTAVVGAPYADISAGNEGAAYVFYRNKGGTNKWGQVAKLTASDGAASDYFGVSVAVSGDYIVVGASGRDGRGTDIGAAYVFYRDQGGTDNWGQVKEITAGDGASGDGFGGAVAVDGTTIVVGASGADGAGTDRGAAYIFYKDKGGDDNWGQAVELLPPTAEDSSQFGYAVSICGDLAAVGWPGLDGAGTDRGAVGLYSRDEGGTDAWGAVMSIVPSDPEDGAWFGYAVSLKSDILAAGAPGVNGGGNNRGAAYLFGKDASGNWTQARKLTASDAGDSAEFGFSVSAEAGGDLVIVGSPYADGAGTRIGHAYVFMYKSGAWGQTQIISSTDWANYDYLGYSVAVSGDFVLTGAPGEDGAGTDRGAAYMFHGN